MSSEGAPSQPPPSGSEKPQTLKPAPGFSSFINKSGAGKKFGPKAVRRRPGATAPAAPPPQIPTPAPLDLAVESQTEAPVESTTAPAETSSSPPPGLLTPDATQEVHTEDTIRTASKTAERRNATEDTSSTVVSAVNFRPSQHESSTPLVNNAFHDDAGRQPSQSPRVEISPLTEEEPEGERSRKRQKINEEGESLQLTRKGASSTQPESLPDSIPAIRSSLSEEQSTPDLAGQRPIAPTVQAEVPDTSTNAIALAPQTADEPIDGPTVTESQLPKQVVTPRKRRVLPWNAVNRPQVEEDAGGESATQQHPVARARPRRKGASPDEGEGEGQETEAIAGGVQEEYQDVNPKPKAKRKTRATPRNAKTREAETAIVVEEGTVDAVTPVKKPRKPRKKKATTVPDGEEAQVGEEGQTNAPQPQPKKKRITRKKKASATVEADGESQDVPPSQRRRAEREPTPSDAEDHRIDPGVTFMDNLASRNIRVGRLSQRERKMREIDWAEVRERRREEEALVAGAEARRALEERLNEAGEARNAASQQNAAPQVQIINGQIVLTQSADNLNRERQADAEIEAMHEIEEDDLTNRITSRSFMKNNKRFPTEFMLPGQGRRWSAEATDQFYEALSRFGTDFMMISTMFPGATRRSIKTKFVREERENPTRIKTVLNAPRRNADWADYLTQSGQTDDNFKDPDAIRKQLEEEGRQMRIEIDAAKEKAAEERRQRHAAGIISDDEGEGGNKENGRKQKKKRGPQATTGFTLRPGEEIVEDDEMPDF